MADKSIKCDYEIPNNSKFCLNCGGESRERNTTSK
jgi:hypothetical protein